MPAARAPPRRRWLAGAAARGPALASKDPAKDVRRNAFGRSSCSPEIQRGMRLWKMVKFGGRIWRKSPIDMQVGEREDLWEQSEFCPQLDMFLSHSWSTAGWAKYVALLMKFYFRASAAIGVAVALLMWLLDWAEVLPTVKVEASELSPWACLPPLVGLVALVLAPHFMTDRASTCFFDATCINQLDERLQMEGVYNLAGFVANSNELVVLWSPEYLVRKWCAFELAMFNVLNAKGKVTFSPPALYVLLLITHVAAIFTVLADTLTCREDPFDNLCKKAPALTVACSFVTRIVRPQLHQMKQFLPQLQSFDVQEAKCRYQVDSEYVEQSIEHWYGSKDAFNCYVRGPLCERTVGDCLKFPYELILLMMWPRFCYAMQWITVQARGGMPPRQLACFFVGALANEAFAVAANLKMYFALATHFSAPQKNKVIEFAINSGISALVVTIIVIHDSVPLLEVVDHSTWNHQPLTQLMFAAIVFLLAAVLFKGNITTGLM